jgi:hypothetical protein
MPFEKGNKISPGRKPGSKNRETLIREHAQAQADAAALEGQLNEIESKETPLEFMLRAMRSTALSYEQRFAASRAAAPYYHPQLQAIAHKHMDLDGNPIAPVINVQVMQAPPEAPRLTHEGPKQGDKVQ